MKCFCLIAIAALSGLRLCAQTNVTGSLPTLRGETVITSAGAFFDLSGREATYHDRVRVEGPQMKLTCEKLVADVPQTGGRIDHIVAETNVVIDFTDEKGQTNHVTCDKAVYVFSVQDGVTNEMATLTGDPQPRMENVQGTQMADVIIWSRVNGNSRVDASGHYHMKLRQNFTPATTATNLPAPTTTTNSPPETIRNSDTNPP
jgi:hypothetical protein